MSIHSSSEIPYGDTFAYKRYGACDMIDGEIDGNSLARTRTETSILTSWWDFIHLSNTVVGICGSNGGLSCMPAMNSLIHTSRVAKQRLIRCLCVHVRNQSHSAEGKVMAGLCSHILQQVSHRCGHHPLLRSTKASSKLNLAAAHAFAGQLLMMQGHFELTEPHGYL